MSEDLEHYGTPRHSGRYPYGSGEDPHQHGRDFLATVEKLRKEGMTEVDIAAAFKMSTTELRAQKSIAKNEQIKAQLSQTVRMREKGMSNTAIADRLGVSEAKVRYMLKDTETHRHDVVKATSDILRKRVSEDKFIDIGEGVETHMSLSKSKLNTAISKLKDEGYGIHYVKVEQLGTGKQTTVKVLAGPGVTYSEVFKNRYDIKPVTAYSEDGGLTYRTPSRPISISSKRVSVRYAEQGGTDKDGVIELRRGVSDLDLGGSRYAQVRIAVDGTHYLKGMAVYTDDMPKGVDIIFNTNKSDKGDPKLAMKGIKDDPDNPFGAIVRQKFYIGKDGKEQQSALNIVNEEGDWGKWSRTLSSQMLSKQPAPLAKKQLGIAYDSKKAAYDEIAALTNPTVKKKLLETFSDGCDSAAVHLKAAALPRQRTHVILPIPDLKEKEIYAPNYRNGESVVLVRFPHGGTFEIPELKVNNKHAGAKSVMEGAIDAVGIHPKVAERLSGADFDGDTVLVIPNNSGAVHTSKALEGLKDFDPKTRYPYYEGMKVMSAKQKQQQMGQVSNLITDMTIRGANKDELARAVRHSMVVIDAEKHKLNYKQSYLDNGIGDLKAKYQTGSSKHGASTLISRASSEMRVLERKPRPVQEGGHIDPKTGEKVYVNTGSQFTDKNGKVIYRTQSSTKMAEAKDARSLSSGVLMEEVYAEHANKLKALGNQARKDILSTPPLSYSSAANRAYKNEVAQLKAELNKAAMNKPLERQAQLLANQIVGAKLKANPNLEPSDIKKIKGQALIDARARTGAKKHSIVISEKQWEAIQAGAIHDTTLSKILDNCDLDVVKQMATPRTHKGLNVAQISRAKAMREAGHTASEIADALGVSTSTLTKELD